jgi:hypothetical protein
MPVFDLAYAFNSLDEELNARMAIEALAATLLLPGTRLFFEPMTDFDRTMDVTHGLLDGRCNPRPAFEILRCLNTLLYSAGVPRVVKADPEAGSIHLNLSGQGDALLSWAGDQPSLARFLMSQSGHTRFGLTCLKSSFRTTGPVDAISDAIAALGPQAPYFLNLED